MLQLKVMHDEVSETENIRKNLAIERMIIEGCDILLDTSQVFVRQGRIASALESYTAKSMCLLQIGNLAYGSVLLSSLVVLDIEKDPFIASPTWSQFYLWYTMLGICLYCLSS